MTIKELQYLLEKYQLSAKKTFGQNFLIDEKILTKITSSLTNKNQHVIEIGPGLGALTRQLLLYYQQVECYEIDKDMVNVLKNEYDYAIKNSQLVINHQDVLKATLSSEQQSDLIANLPYYITTPILIKVLEEAPFINQMVIMIQKEVAQRLLGKPKTKEYNCLSVLLQYYTTIEKVCDVSATSFYPMPSVISTVLMIKRHDVPKVKALHESFFLKINRLIFSNRRKTIINNLLKMVNLTKPNLEEILESININKTARAEELSVEEIVLLSDTIYKQLYDL